jgi:hypothetical membrane protein
MTETSTQVCDPATRVTKSLLGYGVIAGPFYVAVSLIQALTREGFDLTRHAWSTLANGGPGWIQVANFVLTGLMIVAGAIGLRRAGAGVWGPRLLTGYGLGTVGAGIFRADPQPGFPAGTGDVVVSWHGMVHFAVSGVGFLCFVAACFVLARRFVADDLRGWATFSRATGVLFLAGFAAVATGGSWAILVFTAVILLAWTWLSSISRHYYGRTA